MTTHLNPVAYFASVIINSVCGSFFAAAVFGQEVIGDLPPEQWASFVFENYEVVVVGEFPDIPDDVAGNITRQGENEVFIPFEVSAIYKGYVPYDVVQVRLVADMLSYPGEDIARYSKRFETRLEYAAMFEQLNQRFTNLRSVSVLAWFPMKAFRHRKQFSLRSSSNCFRKVCQYPLDQFL